MNRIESLHSNIHVHRGIFTPKTTSHTQAGPRVSPGSRIHDRKKRLLHKIYILCFKNMLTPKAEYLLVRRLSTWSRKASDWGLGGLFGLRRTLTSSLIWSSRSLESEDTDSCLCPIWNPLYFWSSSWSLVSVAQCWSMSQESDFLGHPWSEPCNRSQPATHGNKFFGGSQKNIKRIKERSSIILECHATRSQRS